MNLPAPLLKCNFWPPKTGKVMLKKPTTFFGDETLYIQGLILEVLVSEYKLKALLGL